MARFFKEEDIDEFRECFNLYGSKDRVTTVNELASIMRSLRLSPTTSELRRYLNKSGNNMPFVEFLEVMHEHMEKEKIPADILKAFREQDPRGTGFVAVKELRRLLLHWGDRLSHKELEQIFRETNTPSSGNVKYEDFLTIVCSPLPDY
ncbi:calmodulin-like protein 4 [Pollicipes pollicipes]|uniref:calmodulin-like protein 4 n=1 Tax=Pollicipes pollicipes TaxID=41117 RepID=UPI00188575DE|nr:calmodulin-like protein 4 [Pollicipes pollicipes]